MGVGDSTPPRRQRRRAIRPAGPVGTDGMPAPVSNSDTPAPERVATPTPKPPESPKSDAVVDGSDSSAADGSAETDIVEAAESTDTDGADTAERSAVVDRSAEGPAGGHPVAADPVAEDPAAEDPVEDSAVEDPTIDGGADASPVSSRTRLFAAVALCAVLVVGLVASGIFLFVQNRATDEADARNERFVQTARQTVLNLTTIHPDSAQVDVDRLLAGASGDFKAEFEGREAPFVEVVQQARVDSTGDIVEAGIERQDEDSADVLVAAHAMVKNSDAEEAQPRDFRLRVTVVDADGAMTASRVEFVP